MQEDIRETEYLQLLSADATRLADRLRPTAQERAMRTFVVDRVTQTCEALWDDACHVSVFGSSATGVYLPESDVDVVVAVAFGRADPLGALRRALENEAWVDCASVRLISTARIPLLTFRTHAALGNTRVDITANQGSGAGSTKHAVTWVARHRHVAPLLLILKLFLRHNSCDCVYAGGIGGFSLLCMCYALIEKVARSNPSPSLGFLLAEFFRVYGLDLDYSTTAIDPSSPSLFVPRPDALPRPYSSNKECSLYIIDPSDPSNNVARPSFRFSDIRKLFLNAHLDLQLSASRIARNRIVSGPFGSASGLCSIVWVTDDEQLTRNQTLSSWIKLQNSLHSLKSLYPNTTNIPFQDCLDMLENESLVDSTVPLVAPPPPPPISDGKRKVDAFDDRVKYFKKHKKLNAVGAFSRLE